MSTVTLQIGGKSYAVACADGEEQHIAKLGSMIDEKFAHMGDNLAPQEVQNFLFASLILADELHEAKKAPAPAPAHEPDDDDDDKPNGKKKELRAEIDQLRKLQASLEAERDSLADQLKAAKDETQSVVDAAVAAAAEEAARKATAAAQEEAANAQQTDMFGQDVLAARIEALAAKAESCAEALETGAAAS